MQQLAPAQTRLLALAALRGGERVLDVACGTGLVTCQAAVAVGPSGTVVGTDISGTTVETERGAAFAGGAVALAYSRFDARTRHEAHAEYLHSIAPYRCATGYDIPGEFVVASGRKS